MMPLLVLFVVVFIIFCNLDFLLFLFMLHTLSVTSKKSPNVYKVDFAIKIKDFDTFTKIA